MPDLDTSSFEAFERSGWRDAGTAQSYADGFAMAAEQAVPAMIAAVESTSGEEVLDLCTGHGIVAEALHLTGARVTGLDFSPAMLEMARARVPGATFVEGDAMAMPFDAGRFDMVTMGFGMLHMPDPVQALAEIRRVLHPGGRLAFSVWGGPPGPSALVGALKAATEQGDPSVTLPPGPAIFAFADPGYADPLLQTAGFGEVSRADVACHWVIENADQPVDIMMEGTVRGAALLRAQPAEAMANIRAAVAEDVRSQYGPNGPWQVPVPAIVTRAIAV